MERTRNKQEWKQLNERQGAIKILANATYGMYGFAGARWYCRECAESAAAFGRHHIQEVIKNAENAHFQVLYSDTDSLFVTCPNIEKQAKTFLAQTNKKLPGIIELDLQGMYKKGLFVPQKIGGYTAKKRYVLLDTKGNFVIRGLETVRRDWCDIAKKLQRDVIELILTGKEKEAVNEVRKTIERVVKRQIDIKEIALRTQLGKELEEYKQIGPHVMVAQKLKKAGHIVRQGMVLSFVITQGKGSISERAKSTDMVTKDDYDVEYYINNQIIAVALRVLSVLGYKESDFTEEGLKKFVH